MTLGQLAIKHGTDKSSKYHNYAVIYESYFKHLQHEPILFVECGIGGYENPNAGGQSLRMWREWFTKAKIMGTDINAKKFKIENVLTVQCSQDNEQVMPVVCQDATIFIDDASHVNPLTIKTFELVWPVLAPGAFYVIEDIESSWCDAEGWAKGCSDITDMTTKTSVNLCRELINNLNYKYTKAPDIGIESIHFHKNVVIIKKK